MKKKTLIILSTAIICSFLPWTGRTVPAESVSAPVPLEARDKEDIQGIQEMPEKIPDGEGIQEEMPDKGKIQEEASDEEEIREIQEEAPDEEEIWEIQKEASDEERIQEEIPYGGEEKAATTEAALSRKGGIPIDEAHFPDSNFRRYLVISSFDKNKDGILSEQEIKKVDVIECYGWEIKSFEGVEYFTKIKTLRCGSKMLTSLDVSQNKELRKLDCGNNTLTSLDVSENKELIELDCSNNALTSLDVSQNKELRQLYCGGNALTSLDVSQNRELRQLYCDGNALTSLDVSQNRELRELYCGKNTLTSLDVSQNQKLTGLGCGENVLTSLNVSQNKELRQLRCGYNALTSLDVSQNKKLTSLSCDENALESLDVSQNQKLTDLNCCKNALTSLDVSQNKELLRFFCDDNRLESLVGVDTICHVDTDVGKSISCARNYLKELDLRGASEGDLFSLDCRDNRLTSLQIDENTYISMLHCENNRLSHLDIRKGAGEVYCNDNELISLRLDHVSEVHCQNNVLTELDLRNSPYLCYVDCSENMLRSLDMSRNFLKDLSIGNENIGRQTLICNDNRLESIKFGKDIYLECLYCENNRLRTLDLRKMRQLRALTSDPGTKVAYADAPDLVSLRRDQKGAELTWDHKGVTCDGFFIFRKEGKGGWKRVGEIRKGSGKGRYSYTDKYTGRGDVTYTVAAFQALEPRIDEGAYEDHQGAYDSRGLSASSVPSAPKGIRAAAGNGSAKLTWKKVSGSSGYQIYRKDPKSTKWKKIADVKTGKTSYIDKKVKKGKTYSYCVRAYKKGTGKDKNVIVNGVISVAKRAKIR